MKNTEIKSRMNLYKGNKYDGISKKNQQKGDEKNAIKTDCSVCFGISGARRIRTRNTMVTG